MAAYEWRNKQPIPLVKLWRHIVEYTQCGGEYQFWYSSQDWDPDKPAPEFASWIAEMIRQGFLEPLEGKAIPLTSFGFMFSRAIRIPDSLKPLEHIMLSQDPVDHTELAQLNKMMSLGKGLIVTVVAGLTLVLLFVIARLLLV